ncbi:MAG TPA: hypothetical protein EYG10_04165 [Gammaproteobacteria bacterium]|jgi:hypothetical protein|nr:hypothetical protein [Gammaproteobacteria bacterium]
MKFKKRFLMGLAIVGILLIPSVAKAVDGDAVSANKWTYNSAGDDFVDKADTRELPIRGKIQTLRRNRKAYFEISSPAGTAGEWVTNVNGTETSCTLTNTTASTCTSAPLKIAPTTAVLCIDSELGDVVAHNSGPHAAVRLCLDNTCTLFKSVAVGGVLDQSGSATSCGEAGSATNAYDMLNIGGQTIYIQFQFSSGSTDPGEAGDVASVWIVGN